MEVDYSQYFRKENRHIGDKPFTRRKYKDPVRPIYYAASPDEIYRQGMSIRDDLARSLFFFCYLTGARINEATDFTPSKMTIIPEGVKIRLKTEKARIAIRKTREIFIPLGHGARCRENEMWVEVKRLIRNKDPGAAIFARWKNMSNYLARAHILETDALVKEGDGYIERRISKNMHPHYLRHCRATHLVLYYKFNDTPLCAFFGWANRNMASRYAKMRDLEAAFRG